VYKICFLILERGDDGLEGAGSNIFFITEDKKHVHVLLDIQTLLR